MNNTIANNDWKECPVTNLLVQLGKVLLKDNQRREWLDIETLSELCKENHILMDGKIPSSNELEVKVRELLKKSEELYAQGVNVIFADRRVKWDLVLMARFYAYNPAHNPAPLSSYGIEDTEATEETSLPVNLHSLDTESVESNMSAAA